MIPSRAVRKPGTASAWLLAAALVACGGHRAPGPDAGDADAVTRARALARDDATLPARPEVLALAQSVEALAVKEGAGARAVELHALAASLEERVFRVEHRDQDGKEALDLYRAAGRDLGLPGACDAAVRGAKLAGEIAKDAGTTYAELYRVERRSSAGADAGASTCGRAVTDPLALLAPYRPAPAVLDAIDRGLEGEGAIPHVAGDAGPSRVRVAPRLVRIEEWTGPEAARVVVHLDAPAHFRVGDVAGAGGKGARTYVDLDGVDVAGAAQDTRVSGVVARVVAEATTTGSRVALDLDGPAYRRVFHLLEPYRVVIDIAKTPPGASARGNARTVSRVVVDPGHGGTDPGAKGPTGLKEKDVTLAIAHKLAPVLAREGLEVVLTRDDDRFVALEERAARANGFAADLFVSIHCNASEKTPGKRGVETYVLDTTTSDVAARVAARENATSAAATNEVAQLLASMRLADQASRSTRFAELLQRAGVTSLAQQFDGVVDGGVHRAGFYVLVGARMPAVLFETSYISNAVEEQRLGSEAYQGRLADAIANAIKAYREGR